MALTRIWRAVGLAGPVGPIRALDLALGHGISFEPAQDLLLTRRGRGGFGISRSGMSAFGSLLRRPARPVDRRRQLQYDLGTTFPAA